MKISYYANSTCICIFLFLISCTKEISLGKNEQEPVKFNSANSPRLNFPLFTGYFMTDDHVQVNSSFSPMDTLFKNVNIIHVWGGGFTTKSEDANAYNQKYNPNASLTWKELRTTLKALQAQGKKIICPLFTSSGWNDAKPTFEDYDPSDSNSKFYIKGYDNLTPAERISRFMQHLRHRYIDILQVDGLSIDAEPALIANDYYLQILDSLSTYWGPKSGTNRLLSIVSNDRYSEYTTAIKERKDIFDWVELMGYGGSYGDKTDSAGNVQLFNTIAGLGYPKEKIVFVFYNDNTNNGTGDYGNPLKTAVALTKWEPAGGKKGGIGLFYLNCKNTDYTTTISKTWRSR